MNINSKCFKIIEGTRIVDVSDGILSIIESNRHVPFEIKRVYYIYSLNKGNAKRGNHAHKNLEQAIYCINGSFKLMIDDGINKEYYLICDPNKGYYIGKNLWHTMFGFSNNCIILVLASNYFDENDYIRKYSEFIDYIKIN